MGEVRSPDGTVIDVKRLGNGPPLVLVHGAAVDRRCWSLVLPNLTEHFTVHLMDRRGRRGSSKEHGPYDIKREAEDVAAVVEAAGWNVYLVGHSYGALCSLEAGLITDAIGRMALYEPPVPTPGHPVVSPAVLDRIRALDGDGDMEGVLDTFSHTVLSPTDYEASKDPAVRAASVANAPRILREVESATGFDSSDRLSKITIPVRLLVGTESPAYHRPGAEAIVAAVAHGDLVFLQGQAHMAIVHAPDQFTTELLTFA